MNRDKQITILNLNFIKMMPLPYLQIRHNKSFYPTWVVCRLDIDSTSIYWIYWQVIIVCLIEKYLNDTKFNVGCQVSYDVNNDVGPLEADDDINNNQPSPAFDDLRGIKFTTGPELPTLDDPEPTTYRAPIDFDLGTTAATGIEVSNVVTRLEGDYGDESLASGVTEDETYDDAYETEDETDYTPQNQNIPIVVEESVTAGLSRDQEESLPSYDPVVLLVGTPEKVRSTRYKYIMI